MTQEASFQFKQCFVMFVIVGIMGYGIILFVNSFYGDFALISSHIYSSLSNNWSLRQLRRGENATRDVNLTTHFIIMFNTPHWMNPDQNAYISSQCAYRNCRTTTDRSNLQNESAIFFFLTSKPYLPEKPPLSPYNRNKDQVWIFLWLEPPVRHRKNWAIYKNSHWRNPPNWTVSYSQDADITFTSGKLRRRKPPAKNYSEIFHRKTKQAAWIVSHCKTDSLREKYVKQLRNNGISVDQYGRCSGNHIEPDKKRNRLKG